MMEKKLNFAKFVSLILICVGVTFLGASNSQALPLTNPEVGWAQTYLDVTFGEKTGNYYTDYKFMADELGTEWIEAFCVEDADALGNEMYELISLSNYINEYGSDYVTDYGGDITAAAKVAREFFYGNQTDWTKTLTQIAVWELAFDSTVDLKDGYFRLNSSLSDNDQSILDSILEGSYSSTAGLGVVVSPPGGQLGDDRQNFLVAVPDASIVFLLGSAMLGVAIIGRKKVFSRKG